jgi:membrane protease subunit (stomatin/prohibitin family)
LGLIRLRAFGVFNLRILQPVLFINSLVGTQGVYTSEEIAEYLNRVIVSRFNDYMGEHIDTIFNLPARYNELSDELKKALEADFSQFGLGLASLYINSITPPPEVQKAIDDKSKLGIFDDLNKLLKMKAAMAMENASQNQGGAGEGMGMGMGLMMPAMFADAFKASPLSQAAVDDGIKCPSCQQPVAKEARFCPSCGHQIVVMRRCPQCGESLPANARFCTQYGHPIEEKPQPKICIKCGAENLPNAIFCNHCGERV